MARALHKSLSVTPLFLKTPNIFSLPTLHDVSTSTALYIRCPCLPTIFHPQGLRWYARERPYNLFGGKLPRDAKEFRKEYAKTMGLEDDCLWTGSENDSDDDKDKGLLKEIKKAKNWRGRGITGGGSNELWGEGSGSDEEKTLWTGSELDDDYDTSMAPYPNEKSDDYVDMDTQFGFDRKERQFTLDDLKYDRLLKYALEEEELSPGTQARKLAVENALNKLKKGPDGRYTNVWEVMSDVDILIGAFEKIISGPEYEELRKTGPKKLDMQYFMDIQARMRDPNYRYTPELKLKPKSRMVWRKKYQKTQTRRRKASMR